MGELYLFKHARLYRAMNAIERLQVDECNGVIWILRMLVGPKFHPDDFASPCAYLKGADQNGLFILRGEIQPHERPIELALPELRQVNMAFYTKSKKGVPPDVEKLLRVKHDPQNTTRSNIRYLSFPLRVTRKQVWNDGFEGRLTAAPLPTHETTRGY